MSKFLSFMKSQRVLANIDCQKLLLKKRDTPAGDERIPEPIAFVRTGDRGDKEAPSPA